MFNEFAINEIAINELSLFYPLVENKLIISTRYVCKLVDNQGIDDIEIPISGISGSFNTSNDRNLLIVCPDGKGYASEIALRSNGKFAIYPTFYYFDGTTAIGDAIEENITDLTSDRGGSAWSISIRGLKRISNFSPSSYLAQDVSIININSSGKRRMRMTVDWQVLPGDAVIYNGEEIIVGSISYSIAANPPANYMTVTEA